MNRLITPLKLVLVVLAALPSVGRSISGQTPRQLTVALVEQVPDSAAAAIVRPSGDGSTLVMLRASTADALILGAAMRALSRSRSRHNDTLPSRISIRLYRPRVTGTLPPNEQVIADDYFARLRAAPPTQLAGSGPVRQVRIPAAGITHFGRR